MTGPDLLDPPAAERAAPPRDALAEELRGFGPVGVLALLAIVLTAHVVVGPLLGLPVGAVLALAWAWRSRTPWRDIGYVRPRRPIATVVLGLAIGIALKLVSKAIVLPLLGAPPVNAAYHYLQGNRAMLPLAIYAMLEAGFAEETVFRGYLFERLGRLFGRSTGARAITVVLTSVLFGLGHVANQGLAGAEQAAVSGAVFAGLYLASGSLVLPMVAHAAFDLAALAIIYSGWETRVSHLIFH